MPFIRVENLFVHLPIYNIHGLSLKKYLLRVTTGGRLQRASNILVVEALRGISFEIQDGDRIGLIGFNGSGKTTLLRTLAGVFRPTAGRIQTDGRVVPLIITDVGLNDDAIGHDNIRTCALSLGMTPKEIDQKFDEIVAFTELGEYLHLPLYALSTGMRTRISFAVATAIDAEILLLDEVIGTGDAAFVTKAMARFDTLITRTRILMIASHNLGWVRTFCNKTMLLVDGRLIEFGPTEQVLATYTSLIEKRSA